MTEILSALREKQEQVRGVDEILADKELGDLFHTFIQTPSPLTKDLIDVMQKKGPDRTPAEVRRLDNASREFSKRLTAAESLLATIHDSGISDLQETLEISIPRLEKGTLPLYIKGLAVRNPANLATLRNNITTIEGEVRARGALKEIKEVSSKLDKLTSVHGISSERLHLLKGEADNAVRLGQINAALGGNLTERRPGWLGYLRKDLDIGQSINSLIVEYRGLLTNAESAIKNFGMTFSAMDTSDEFFTDRIPALLKSDKSLAENQKPLKLEQIQEMMGSQGILSELEKTVKNDFGGDAGLTEFRKILKANSGMSPADLMKVPFTQGGSTATFEDIYNQTADRMEADVGHRNWLSKLVEAIFGSIFKSEVLKQRDDVFSLAKTK